MTYKTGGRSVVALEGIDLSVRRGEFVTLLGPSGCGKSTILRLVADILAPTEGRIMVLGTTPAQARKQRMFSFMFQDPVLFPWRSTERNVQLPLELLGVPRAEREAKARALLEAVRLTGFGDRAPRELSGGMRMRAALARALTLEPPLILMDEPFGALDEITRDRMNLELLRVWTEKTAAVLFVTHSIDEAVFLSDRVVVLSPRPGRVCEVIDIDVPRPRPTELAARSEALFAHALRVRRALHSTVEAE